jgi:hypothetical protein
MAYLRYCLEQVKRCQGDPNWRVLSPVALAVRDRLAAPANERGSSQERSRPREKSH